MDESCRRRITLSTRYGRLCACSARVAVTADRADPPWRLMLHYAFSPACTRLRLPLLTAQLYRRSTEATDLLGRARSASPRCHSRKQASRHRQWMVPLRALLRPVIVPPWLRTRAPPALIFFAEICWAAGTAQTSCAAITGTAYSGIADPSAIQWDRAPVSIAIRPWRVLASASFKQRLVDGSVVTWWLR